MVIRCPSCLSLQVRFCPEGKNAGNYECQDCAFVGEPLFEEDEFQDPFEEKEEDNVPDESSNY